MVLSPRVQYRFPHYIFVDIGSTQHLMGGEMGCLEKALQIAAKFAPDASAAIGDTPAGAQMLAKWRPSHISLRGKEQESFKGLGLDALKDLEGLSPWAQKKPVEHMIAFFHTLGVYGLEGVLNFRLNSLRERWGILVFYFGIVCILRTLRSFHLLCLATLLWAMATWMIP
ncbi:hypothetical protein [Bdellovibrio bacteriovorus]|uniref:hypothetical protein n=1 Tax=Bdellovibrio bacteriovorus TaxID=959 RepID=UPI0035A68CDF